MTDLETAVRQLIEAEKGYPCRHCLSGAQEKAALAALREIYGNAQENSHEGTAAAAPSCRQAYLLTVREGRGEEALPAAPQAAGCRVGHLGGGPGGEEEMTHCRHCPGEDDPRHDDPAFAKAEADCAFYEDPEHLMIAGPAERRKKATPPSSSAGS
jgi:hypothetical protein